MAEDFLFAAVICGFMWLVGQKVYPKRAPKDHPGMVFPPRHRLILRILATLMLIAILIDVWYRMTGRGQFIH